MSQTSKLDRSIIDELVADRVGRRARHMRAWDDPESPLGYIARVTLEQAAKGLSREMVIYWIEGGLPEYFSLPGLNPAPIIFSARYIEICETLLRIWASEESDLIAEDILAPCTQRYALQIVAELALRGGDASTAAYLFARSLTDNAMLMAPSSIKHIEEELMNETFMALWFFVLLHEIGHVHTEERSGEKLLSLTDVREAVEFTMTTEGYSSEMIAEITGHLDARGGNPLHPDQLGPEVAADKFAFETLMRSSQHRPTADSTAILAISVFDLFNVFTILNMCAAAARHITDPTSNLRYDQWLIMGFHVRANFLLRHVATLLAALPSEQGWADSQSASFWESFLAAGSRRHESRLRAVQSGLDQALEQAYRAEIREIGVGERVRSILLDSNSTEGLLGQVELKRFMELADSLEISHPDLEFLRTLLPPTRRRSVHTTQLEFYSLWIRDSSGLKRLLTLEGGKGYLAFIFCMRTSLYYDFKNLIGDNLPSDCILDEVIIKSAWEFDVFTICARAVPISQRASTRIVVEGSNVFDRLIKEAFQNLRGTEASE
jgi:hypothetical protein